MLPKVVRVCALVYKAVGNQEAGEARQAFICCFIPPPEVMQCAKPEHLISCPDGPNRSDPQLIVIRSDDALLLDDEGKGTWSITHHFRCLHARQVRNGFGVWNDDAMSTTGACVSCITHPGDRKSLEVNENARNGSDMCMCASEGS